LPFIKTHAEVLAAITEAGIGAARLMLTLAGVFPYQERSAIKVVGGYHADSVTD
jgi:hypothetical protein